MKKAPPAPQFGLAIDWETSGFSLPNYTASHQGIAFGAAIFKISTLDIIETMYREIKFDPKYEWTPRAEAVHGITRAHLEAHGVSQQEAALDLGNLIVKYVNLDEIILLGHRVYFDEAFTNQLMATIDVTLAYDPIRIDSAAFGLVFAGTTTSDNLFAWAGLPAREKHNALEDIIYTLEAMKKIKGA